MKRRLRSREPELCLPMAVGPHVGVLLGTGLASYFRGLLTICLLALATSAHAFCSILSYTAKESRPFFVQTTKPINLRTLMLHPRKQLNSGELASCYLRS